MRKTTLNYCSSQLFVPNFEGKKRLVQGSYYEDIIIHILAVHSLKPSGFPCIARLLYILPLFSL